MTTRQFVPPPYARNHSLAAYDVYDSEFVGGGGTPGDAYESYSAHDPYRAPGAPRPYAPWHAVPSYAPSYAPSPHLHRNYGIGQGADTIGGPAACTTIAVLAGFYALYHHPDDIDMVNVMTNAAIMWRRDSCVFQNVREVFRQTPDLAELVGIARDDNAEVFGNALPRSEWTPEEREPAFMLRTVSQTIDVLDAARRAIAALPAARRRNPRFDKLILNACAVLTTNDGSTMFIATPDGFYYELDSHGSASLYLYKTRADVERAIRTAATPDPTFAFTILAPPHASTLDIVL